jgi:hypothetical protein
LTSKTPGGRQPAMAATSASDRHRSGVASARSRSAGSDSRETAGTNGRGRGLEGDQNPWKDRGAAPRKRASTSRTRRWSKASWPTGATRVATHGSCAAGGLLSFSSSVPGGSCKVDSLDTVCAEKWQTPLTATPHPEGTAARPRPPGARRNRRPL